MYSFVSLSEHMKYLYHHIELHIFGLFSCPYEQHNANKGGNVRVT